jgi:hypothetical protein
MQKVLIAIAIATVAAYAGISASNAAKNTTPTTGPGSMTGTGGGNMMGTGGGNMMGAGKVAQ